LTEAMLLGRLHARVAEMQAEPVYSHFSRAQGIHSEKVARRMQRDVGNVRPAPLRPLSKRPRVSTSDSSPCRQGVATSLKGRSATRRAYENNGDQIAHDVLHSPFDARQPSTSGGDCRRPSFSESAQIERQRSSNALILCFFFLIFGNLILRLFDVPLSMVRIVGGIILMKIGFELFSPSTAKEGAQPAEGAAADSNVAFVPLALLLMCGPGAIAAILGMTATVKHAGAELYALAAVSGAIVATMFVTCLALAHASKLTEKIGPMGIDATTRIVGFFVSAMGVGLIFNGVVEAL
jgi:multiple antibiotic resistance protein